MKEAAGHAAFDLFVAYVAVSIVGGLFDAAARTGTNVLGPLLIGVAVVAVAMQVSRWMDRRAKHD